MAVEARHHLVNNVFPSQIVGNREIAMNPIEANSNFYNTQRGYGGGFPLSGTTTTDSFIPASVYGSVISDSFFPQKPMIKSDSSTLTKYHNLPLPSRKRPNAEFCAPFSFIGYDMSSQIQEQQLDVDRLISQHMEKVRMEIDERRKRQARRVMDAVEETVMKQLKAKEEEIEKIGKLNWALQERVKSLCMENQIWRDLARSNEAAANALRTNLEQVLASAPVTRQGGLVLDEEVLDDAASCCGSSWEDNNDKINDVINGEIGISSRLCRNCRKEESSVLLLPCRHLCLCTVCGSSLRTCPVCKSTKTVTVHVNLS